MLYGEGFTDLSRSITLSIAVTGNAMEPRIGSSWYALCESLTKNIVEILRLLRHAVALYSNYGFVTCYQTRFCNLLC